MSNKNHKAKTPAKKASTAIKAHRGRPAGAKTLLTITLGELLNLIGNNPNAPVQVGAVSINRLAAAMGKPTFTTEPTAAATVTATATAKVPAAAEEPIGVAVS